MMSALLTMTMPNMKVTMDALKEAVLGEVVKTMVGIAPKTQAFAEKIEVDGYAPNAAEALELAKNGFYK